MHSYVVIACLQIASPFSIFLMEQFLERYLGAIGAYKKSQHGLWKRTSSLALQQGLIFWLPKGLFKK